MATFLPSKVSYSGSPNVCREIGTGGVAPAIDIIMAQAPYIKRSWIQCVRLASPELRILAGFVLLASIAASAWMLKQGVQSLVDEGLKTPSLLAAFSFLTFAPPLVFNFRSSHPQWRFISGMLGIGWRSTFSLLALMILMLSQTGQDFLLSSGLVACYFPLLVLQSWLLTRQAKRL